MSIVKPFLKWVGGKTQILHNIMQCFPKDINNYREPFVGGGSILLALLSNVENGDITLRGHVYASDKNARLIALYTNLQHHPDIVITELKKLRDLFNTCKGNHINRKPMNIEEALTSHESMYYWVRQEYNSMDDITKLGPKAAAMFIFLNKTCFRGLYREGPNGFNVPFGHYSNPCIFEESHIWLTSYLIRDVIFSCSGFDQSLELCEEGDFVYLDPPYAPETTHSFVGYMADGFNEGMHNQLFRICHELNEKKIAFTMSNADVSLVRNNFPSEYYDVKVIECKRAINSKKPDSKTMEVIITPKT